MHLLNKLFNIKGEGLSVTNFVDKITHIADNLALAEKSVDDDDLVSIIMNNIALAFEATVSSAEARDTLISYDDLVALLLGKELRNKSRSSPVLDATPTALYAPTQSVSSSQGYNNQAAEPPSVGVGVGAPIPHHHRLPYLRRLRAWSCVRSAIVLGTRH